MIAATPNMPTLLLVNPRSRRGRQYFERYRRPLAHALNLVDWSLTDSRQHMTDRIQEGLNNGISRFIIGGGDGTLSAAADVLAGTPGVLGVLPLGTGNTFFYGLGLPLAPDELVPILSNGTMSLFDVGVAQKDQETTVFLNSLTIGFSERLVELLRRESKDRLGHWAWAVEFRRALKDTPTIHVQLTWPGGHDHYDTRQLVVVNGRTLAARITATPHSSAQDGLLEVFRLGGPSFLSMLRLSAMLLLGRLPSDHQAHYHTLTGVNIECDPVLPVNIDGDIWLSPPLRCRVWPGALRVISRQMTGPGPRRWPFITQAAGPSLTHSTFTNRYSLKRGQNVD